ncbi:MAG: hypothetical protein LCH84_10525 [Gemmatimonadetes bacterium]|nr:hypothetical protein [Gemmatimonadota bacterium]
MRSFLRRFAVRSALGCALICAAASALVSARPRVADAQPSPTAIVDRLRATSGRSIDFHAAIYPDTVYVGQQATYQVAVLLDGEARARLRRNPEFLPPELRGLLAFELGSPRRVPSRPYQGGEYEAHVFQRALFAVGPGALVVPSPQLTYNLPQSSSYFSREERFVVRAESAQLVVRALPDSGRPADFLGAVGNYRASTRLDATTARVGDPLVLTVRIEGVGNVKLLPRPLVEVSWASVVAGTERVQLDTSGALVRGAREFDYILTPAQSGPVVLPVVRYPFFNPTTRQYEVAQSTSADIVVADGALAGAAAPDEVQGLTLRPWRQRTPMQLDRLPPWLTTSAWTAALLMPLLALAAAVQSHLDRRRERAPDVPVAPTRAVFAESDTPAGAARRVRRDLLGAVAKRLAVVPADLVTAADVRRIARRRGVSREGTRELLALLDALAVAGFAGDGQSPDAPSLEREAQALLARVDAEAVRHGRTRLWSRRRTGATSALLLLACLAARPVDVRAQGARPDNAASGVAVDGVVREATAAYEARRFGRAAERFAEAVRARTGDADLLVNWGTAAWAAGDTVASVVAWQRAARLEPFAADVQLRLAMLPPGAREGVADIPMIPVLPLATLAVLAWTIGAVLLLLAWRPRTAPRLSWRAGTALMLLGATSAGAAWWGHTRLDATALAVVRRPEPMRVAPAQNANTNGGTATGDVVRRLATRDDWTQVVHADGREGWLPNARLVALTAPLLVDDATR